MDNIPSSSHTPPETTYRGNPHYGGYWPKDFYGGRNRYNDRGDRISPLSPPQVSPETDDALQQLAERNKEVLDNAYSNRDQGGLRLRSSHQAENSSDYYPFPHSAQTEFQAGSFHQAESQAGSSHQAEIPSDLYSFPQFSPLREQGYTPAYSDIYYPGFDTESSHQAEFPITQFPFSHSTETAHEFPQSPPPHEEADTPGYPDPFHPGFSSDHLPIPYSPETDHHFPQCSLPPEEASAPPYSASAHPEFLAESSQQAESPYEEASVPPYSSSAHPGFPAGSTQQSESPHEEASAPPYSATAHPGFPAGSSQQTDSPRYHSPVQSLTPQERAYIYEFVSANHRTTSRGLTPHLRELFAKHPNTKFSIAQLQRHFPQPTEKQLIKALKNIRDLQKRDRSRPTLTRTPMNEEEANRYGWSHTFFYSLDTSSAKP